MEYISILGSTGSIGKSTLDVLSQHKDKYKVYALAGWSQIDLLFEQCLQFFPEIAVVRDADLAFSLDQKLKQAGRQTEVLYGPSALVDVVSSAAVDIVMAAIVGFAGLPPVFSAAKKGKRILLANKESLVVAGRLLLEAVDKSGALLLPVDSEHSAIFQSLPDDPKDRQAVEKIILTASGGPFRGLGKEELAKVTLEQACAHPNWSMGQKISIDSATLMNKGLEVIEAYWLFGVSLAQIEVVVHPQSIIHSMVQYCDGAVMSQLGMPDMRTPIAYALSWPQRIAVRMPRLNWTEIGSLTFEAPDVLNFRCLRLAYDALHHGGDAAAVLNAANEEAVKGFINRRISFLDIPNIIEETLVKCSLDESMSLSELLEKDKLAREVAQGVIALC